MKAAGSSSYGFESVSSQRPAETGHTARNLHDAGFVLLIILGLAVLLFACVALLRRPARRLGHFLRHSPESAPRRKSRDSAAGTTHRRRRRPRHRMNPSRAQIGGLPPKRPDPPLGPANT